MVPEQTFIQQIEEHQRIIHKVCNVYVPNVNDRDDLFQEILLNAWKGFSNFKGDAKFSTWLYKVALNTAITFYRKEKRQPVVTQLHEELWNQKDQHNKPDERLSAMYQAISMLSDIDKAIVMLYLDDYSYNDVGEMMGISPNNVAVKMNRIKTKLKESTKKLITP